MQGKTFTTENGKVLTDVGPAIVNDSPSEYVRNCIADDGTMHQIIARVVRETPETLRRANLPKYIY